jgi:methylenetetrahydrofolate reductase (NADPH)
MKIVDILKKPSRTFSFEFFPPRDEISAVDFGINVGQLLKLDPSFVSVTYGAGGSNQERTFKLVDYLQNKIGLTTMAHYTCVGASEEKIAQDMTYIQQIGIENVMLLRGDPPQGTKDYFVQNIGFSYASELISFVKKKRFNFSIGAAANPEKHPESPNMDEYVEKLKIKVNSGVDFLLTQLFFDNEVYYNFVKKARKAGITCKIIPGIIPLTSYKQIHKFVNLAATSFPAELLEKMELNKDNTEKAYQTGLAHAIKQCVDLLENGAPGIHFYTLNKSRAAVEVYESIPGSLRQ